MSADASAVASAAPDAAEAQARNAAVVRHLGALYVDTLRPLLGRARRVALIDYPNHSNVGDSAIWLGERAALTALGVAVDYACDLHAYRPEELRRAVGPEGTILMHGGGNFGDVWPGFQEFRFRVVRDFPDATIIQLPQSLHFATADSIARTRAQLAGHPRYTLMVRDHRSLAIARDQLELPAVLCPDSAFCLGMQPRGAPAGDLLVLSRTDHEQVAAYAEALAEAGGRAEDWVEDERTRAFRALDAFARWYTWGGRRARVVRPLMSEVYDRLAWQRVRRGLRQLRGYRVIATDRLHTHILAMLLGIPHVLLDNYYRKLGSFHESWTAESPLGIPVTEPSALPQALARARTLV